jgi:hypothetical protein
MPVRPTTTPTKKPAARIEKKASEIRSCIWSSWAHREVEKLQELY